MPWQQDRNFNIIAIFVLVIVLVSSCTVPKRYQQGKPFVFSTNINVSGDLSTREKQDLKEKLLNQIDDSLKVRTVLSVRVIPPFFFYKLLAPAVFDSASISRSKTYMTSLMTAQGYFRPIIRDTFTIDSVRDQQRVHVRFNVNPGKMLRIDSVGYDLADSSLQALSLIDRDKALIKKGDPYTLAQVSNELDRLLTMYRNNGYFRISKEDLYVEHDTVVAALIDPTIDPFEQLRLLDSLQKKKENPTVSIVFKQRLIEDSTHLNQYTIGDVTVYPDLALFDSTENNYKVAYEDSIKFLYSSNKFKFPFLARNISLKKGDLYKLENYFNTLNTFTNFGAWAQVNVDLVANDSLSILDPVIKLYPARKYNLSIDFETSRNASDVITTGSLFGLGFNFGLSNRNTFKESIQSTSNLRLGVELGTQDLIQTVQASFSHSIFIPRLIIPFMDRTKKSVTSGRTVVNFNTAYTNRRDFLQVRSVNTSWGYDWTRKSHNWQYIPFNFEFSTVDETDSLRRLKEQIPSLRYALNDGLVISQIATYNYFKLRGDNRSAFQVRLEESGALFGLVKRLDRGDLRRFIKADVEYKYFIENRKSTWAFRMFGGYGYTYGKAGDSLENNLPFWKAYFGGGPYSMRAWQVRGLGFGSNVIRDSAGNIIEPIERLGDIKLEANIEYRFDLGRLFGIKLESALFTDIGNVWVPARKNNQVLEGSEFKLNRLYKDLAVAGGTSLRIDFDFFLIRFDWAYKIKNPLYSDVNNGWFQNVKLKEGTFQLGIGYPF